MAKNTDKLNAGSDNPSLARVDIRDMFNALGYDDAGAATSGTVYALAEKLSYNLATNIATLTGGITAGGSGVTASNTFKTDSASALNVKTALL